MNLLIVGQESQEFRQVLEPKFPEISIHAAMDERAADEYIDRADILIAIRISDGLLAKAVRLKWIHSMISGIDFFEKLPSFQRRDDILLTSTRGIHGPQMSELAIMLMIALSRGFPQMIQNQEQKIWERWPPKLNWKKTVGILGVGVVGSSIAHKCKAFDMTVLGVGPTPRPVAAVDRFYGLACLHQVMADVDYFICVAPSTPTNNRILDAEGFARMKPTAFFINLGRGELVDEAALIQVLRERRIAGAALDTFQVEPLPPEHPFWSLDNVIIAPHVGGMSDIYVGQASGIIEENLRRFLDGQRDGLLNVVRRGAKHGRD